MRGGRGERCQDRSPPSQGPRCRKLWCQHSPRTWARCTAGRSPCTARARSYAGCLSLWGEERSRRVGGVRHAAPPPPLAAVPPRLTQLPAPHVVELGAQQQGGHDVDDGEDNPEGRVPLAKDLQDEQGQWAAGGGTDRLTYPPPPAPPVLTTPTTEKKMTRARQA